MARKLRVENPGQLARRRKGDKEKDENRAQIAK